VASGFRSVALCLSGRPLAHRTVLVQLTLVWQPEPSGPTHLPYREMEALDEAARQQYNCVMLPPFEPSGTLPPGIHWTDWREFSTRFGTKAHRQRLLAGLKAALDALRRAGCRTVYIDGSFVTAKDVPGDFDACWDMAGVDPRLLDPILLTFDHSRAAQKAKFLGELFPSSFTANPQGLTFLEFFQVNKETGLPKGIVALDLRGLP
jgi:hypothetical protein